MIRRFHIQKSLANKDGFALPSVLFLVTILSLVILSILTLKYFHRQRAFLDVARVQADYAALDGINRAIIEMNSADGLSEHGKEIQKKFDLGPNKSADISIQRWGLYYVMASRGRVGRVTSERVAMIAGRPPDRFDNALLFANSHHQLVLTGTTKIKGNVVTGLNGVTIGILGGMQTPRTIPIEGKIRKEPTPLVLISRWKKVIEDLQSLSQGKSISYSDPNEVMNLTLNSPIQLDSTVISQKVKYIFSGNDVFITGRILRRSAPLFIFAQGNVELQQNADIEGLIAIISKKSIVVISGCTAESAILFSQTSIEVKENVRLSAQLFAPSIQIASYAVISYPSVLISFPPKDPKKDKQEILLSSGSRIEGTVAMLSESTYEKRSIINLQSGSKVVGAVVSEGFITLDGSVDGAVITKDFYFYENPTTYLGWIRTGRIDRAALPSSFLIPPDFSESDQLNVLDWL